MSGHTKLPWKIFTSRNGRKLVGIGSEEGEGICDAGFGVWAWNDAEGIANANLLVKAVNAHEDLLCALKLARTYLIREGGKKRVTFEDLATVESAIAKAEGNQS